MSLSVRSIASWSYTVSRAQASRLRRTYFDGAEVFECRYFVACSWALSYQLVLVTKCSIRPFQVQLGVHTSEI